MLESEARKASAAPWKLVRTLGGTPMSRSAASIAFTAPPSEARGARLNDTVVEGNWPRWLMASEEGRSMIFAIEPSGTCWPVTEGT